MPKVKNLQSAAMEAFGKTQYRECISHLQEALKLAPKHQETYYNLGVALMAINEQQPAITCFKQAIKLNARDADAFNNLGLVYIAQGKVTEASKAFQSAIDINPTLLEAHGNLGNALRTRGLLEESWNCFQHALHMAPKNADIHKTLLLTLMYMPGQTNQMVFEQVCRFQDSHETMLGVRPPMRQTSNKKLRIGYVSSDFKNHPVGINLAPLIEHHNHQDFEIFLYGEVPNHDVFTQNFQTWADHWRSTVNKTDAEVAAQIKHDQIDILIFLAGILDNNRLLLANQRAAPIQVSYHNLTSTGLKSIDYWLTDSYLHPENKSESFTESLLHLPQFYVYPAMNQSPEITPTPALKQGHITFGSFNNPAKLNHQVLELWAALLLATKNSKLLLKYAGVFQSADNRNRFLEKFASFGVDKDRILFQSQKEPQIDHLARYGQVDIALDPFPFNGATTTFEALWMGVPVVTLKGHNFRSRAAGSILHILGLDHWIAESAEQYIAIAKKMSSDFRALNQLRQGLRPRMIKSRLCDGATYAKHLESILKIIVTS
ncbi:MAG: tetratricopeptide repeat protein [Myxococcota bacterium]|nr:tetratricopeptide repeat protein [Myxococcota bacterium]